MSKVTCTQNGNLRIKCKACGYSWNTPVVANQEVNDKCSNCLEQGQIDIVLTVQGTKGESIDIPPFMINPVETVRMSKDELKSLLHLHYTLGRNQGISLGLSIGIVLLGIVLFFLFAPLTVVPV